MWSTYNLNLTRLFFFFDPETAEIVEQNRVCVSVKTKCFKHMGEMNTSVGCCDDFSKVATGKIFQPD